MIFERVFSLICSLIVLFVIITRGSEINIGEWTILFLLWAIQTDIRIYNKDNK